MMWLGTIAACATLWILGTLALDAVRARPESASHDIASAVATGAALLAALGTMLIVGGLRLSLLPFYVLVLVLTIPRIRVRGFRLPRPDLPRDRVAIAALACCALVLAAIAAASLHDRLWWDGWAIWTLKARVLFLEGSLPAAFLSDAYAFTHFDYPLAVPLVDWWVWLHAGSAAPQVASIVGALWFALLPLLLWGALRARADTRVAALAALGVTLFWPIAYYATGGTADVVIAFALLGAVIELERALAPDGRAAMIRCGAFVTLAVLAKNEGLAIAVIVAAVAAVGLLRAGGSVRRLVPLALPFVALAPWWLFASRLGAHAPVIDTASAGAIGARAPILFSRVASLLSSIAWLPIPVLVTAGLFAAMRQSAPSPGWLVLGAYLCVVTAVYLLTPHDLDWLITTSLPRVLSVFVPSLVFLSVAAASAQTAAPLTDASVAWRVAA